MRIPRAFGPRQTRLQTRAPSPRTSPPQAAAGSRPQSRSSRARIRAHSAQAAAFRLAHARTHCCISAALADWVSLSYIDSKS